MSQRAGALGLGLATALVAGNMIGSGIYLLPASLGAYGSIGVMGWVGASIAAIIYASMFACASVAQGDARRGFTGPVVAAFGRSTGFVAGGLYWVQAILGNVAIALAVTGYLIALFPALGLPVAMVFTTILVIWVLVLANLVGARLVGYIEAASLLFGLLPILLVATLGWAYFDAELFVREWNVSGRPAEAIAPEMIVLALWAFLGLESASVAAKHVENPRRNVPLATVGGVLLAAVIYIAASTVLSGILPASELARSTAPFADATSVVLGSTAAVLIAVCAAFKASGTLAGWILLSSEAADATMTIDGEARPTENRARARRQLLASGVVMSAIVIATADASLAVQFGRLANAVVIVTICVYAMVGAAVLRTGVGGGGAVSAASRWLGAAGVLMSFGIIATQDWFTIATTVTLVIVVILIRIVQQGRRRAFH